MSQPHSHCCAEETYRAYLAGLLAADRQRCSAVFQQCLDSNTPLRDIYMGLVQRSLYEVGELCERGEISVGEEHLATAITESVLGLAYPRLFAGKRSGKSAVIACVPNDHHQIGGRIVADYFELNKWRSYFLGGDTPVSEMLSLIAQRHPEVVVLSATTPSNVNAAITSAAEIRAVFPSVPILVGGQALDQSGRERAERLPGVLSISSLVELDDWIRENSHDA